MLGFFSAAFGYRTGWDDELNKQNGVCNPHQIPDRAPAAISERQTELFCDWHGRAARRKLLLDVESIPDDAGGAG